MCRGWPALHIYICSALFFLFTLYSICEAKGKHFLEMENKVILHQMLFYATKDNDMENVCQLQRITLQGDTIYY